MATAREPLLAEEGQGALPPAHSAVNNDDVKALQALPRDAWQQIFLGGLPVHRAAARNSLAALDCLVSSNPDWLDIQDFGGRTPLFHAVAFKASEAVVWLMRRGCQVGLVESRHGWCPTHWAAKEGSSSMLALLGTLGADLEVRDAQGRTPLAVAVSQGSLEAVEYLVLTRGCSREVCQEARREVEASRGPCAFWIARCLEHHVGANERRAGELRGCSPTEGGCGLPCKSRCFSGPEQVHVEPAQISVLSGILAVVAAITLLGLPSSSWSPAPGRAVEVLVCRTLAAVSLFCTLAGTVSWCRAANKAAGSVDHSCPERRSRYQAALDKAAAVTMDDAGRKASNWWGEQAPMIHQLAIVGPERSKYCKATRQCVPVFDHYCVFLHNTVGQENYGAFFCTILWSGTSCACLSQAGALLYYSSPDGPILWFASCITLYFGLFAVMWAVMIFFHLYLASYGLTAWEMHQCMRQTSPPEYLTDPTTGSYKNPYNLGMRRNLFSRLFPEPNRPLACADQV